MARIGLEGLGERHEDATVRDFFTRPGAGDLFGVGVGVGQRDHTEADVLGDTQFPVGVGSVVVVLDVLVADVADQTPTAGQTVVGVQFDVVAAVGIARRVSFGAPTDELVRNRVAVLGAQEFPACADVKLGGIRIIRPGNPSPGSSR